MFVVKCFMKAESYTAVQCAYCCIPFKKRVQDREFSPLASFSNLQHSVSVFLLFNEKFHIDSLLVFFITHCYRHTFISNCYRRKTTKKTTKICFLTGIVDTSRYPTLHSLPPYPSRTLSVHAVSLFNSQILYN